MDPRGALGQGAGHGFRKGQFKERVNSGKGSIQGKGQSREALLGDGPLRDAPLTGDLPGDGFRSLCSGNYTGGHWGQNPAQVITPFPVNEQYGVGRM